MEESASSSRTNAGAAFFYRDNADCYGHSEATAAASEDSGWTAYFDDDDDYLQASTEEPAPLSAPRENKLHGHLHHGDCASAITVSSASANANANANENRVEVKTKDREEKKKKKPRLELEDPLQDTATSPANATQLQQQQDAWQIAECEERQTLSAAILECRRHQWDHWDGQVQKKGICLVPLKTVCGTAPSLQTRFTI